MRPSFSRLAFVISGALLVGLLVFFTFVIPTRSAGTSETLAARARAIGEQLACPVCEGETVADSPSALAIQMRQLIAQQVAGGWSDQQIRQFFVARYGPGILLNPPKQGVSLGVWLVPVIVILASTAGVVVAAVRWSSQDDRDVGLPAELTDDEQRELEQLMRSASVMTPFPGPAPSSNEVTQQSSSELRQ
ncbi:MAG: cytochrome c-type biogenesis protein CcmH [Chloroflexi bacterium]|nr:cytochrome c-type biogenesis protein CcmH [Chloroflexota bacterium]